MKFHHLEFAKPLQRNLQNRWQLHCHYVDTKQCLKQDLYDHQLQVDQQVNDQSEKYIAFIINYSKSINFFSTIIEKHIKH